MAPGRHASAFLTDPELSAVWRAADRLGYPYGPLVHLLILTGQRLNEIAALSWPEVDLVQRVITIRASRMKGGRAQEVPVAAGALSLPQSLPRFNAGDFVFTTTGGVKPVNGFSKTKARLDSLSGVKAWVLHDIRRTVRTHFSALSAQDLARELAIAHVKPGLHRVYDQHTYQDEKRECFSLWEARLRPITAAAG